MIYSGMKEDSSCKRQTGHEKAMQPKALLPYHTLLYVVHHHKLLLQIYKYIRVDEAAVLLKHLDHPEWTRAGLNACRLHAPARTARYSSHEP